MRAARSATRWRGPATFEELQNIANFLMAPGQCDWLTGQSIMMDGANALANGSDFFELRHWTDARLGRSARSASKRRTRRIDPDGDQDRDLTIATARAQATVAGMAAKS